MRRLSMAVLLVLALVFALSEASLASSGKIGGEYWVTGDITYGSRYVIEGSMGAVSGEFYISPKTSVEVFYATTIGETPKEIVGNQKQDIAGSDASASILFATGKYVVYGNSITTLSPFLGYYSQTGNITNDKLNLSASGFVLGAEAEFSFQDNLAGKITIGYSPFLKAVHDQVEDIKSSVLHFAGQISYRVTENIAIDGGYRYFGLTLEETSDQPYEVVTGGVFLGASLYF